MNNQDSMMYQQQGGRSGYNMQNQQMAHPNSVWNQGQSRQNLDMPNLQNLGINSQGTQNPSNQGQNNSRGGGSYTTLI